MATIEEFNSNMTIFYYKSDGGICSVSSGIQDINIYFGEHSADYTLILEQVILPNDQYVLNNIKSFKINTETKQLEMLPSAIPSYPIATT